MTHRDGGGSAAQASVTVAWAGDSRAVLCRGGRAHDMSEAHNPNRPDEKERIEAANGWITVEKELMMSRLHQMDLSDPEIREQAEKKVKWVEISRVNGELAVARALGDAGGGRPDSLLRPSATS